MLSSYIFCGLINRKKSESLKMKKSLGIWRSWALVVGTIIGSGVFTLPAVLAPYGSFSFIGWGITALGALCLSLSLCHLAARNPALGGPYAYVYEAFGKTSAMIVAWGYWISLWVGVAAIAVSFAGYLAIFIPALSDSTILSSFVSIIAVIVFTYINVRGVEEASIVQLITVILKMIPLVIIGFAGIFMGDITDVPALNPKNEPFFAMITGICLLVMWSYIGIEAATIPSEDTINPKKTIPRALLFGTLTTTAIYIIAMAGVMAIIPVSELQFSTSPFSDAAKIIFGEMGSTIVGVGALIAIGGALNSMILLTGSIPLAGARDNLFPVFFKMQNKSGTPVTAIIISSILAMIVIMINSTKGLLDAFELMIIISTFTVLIAYLGSALASLKLQISDQKNGVKLKHAVFSVSIIATLFSILALIGAWTLYN